MESLHPARPVARDEVGPSVSPARQVPAPIARGILLAVLVALFSTPLTAEEATAQAGGPKVRSFFDAQPRRIGRELRQARDLFKGLPQAPREAARYITGLAANLEDPDWHQRDMLFVQGLADVEYLGLLASTGAIGDCMEWECKDPAEHEGEDWEQDKDPGACPDSLRGCEVELKLGELLSISATCEKIGVEVGADVIPGLGAFVKVEVGRDGGVGVQMGPKAEVGVAGQSVTVKDGMYVEPTGEHPEEGLVTLGVLDGQASADQLDRRPVALRVVG